MIWINLRYAAGCAGYWIRPYDMLADRRRWKWQRAQRCGLDMSPEDRAALTEAVIRKMQADKETPA